MSLASDLTSGALEGRCPRIAFNRGRASDQYIEYMILGGLMSDPEFSRVALVHLRREYFSSQATQCLLEEIQTHWLKYEAPPTCANIAAAVCMRQLAPECQKATLDVLEKCAGCMGQSETKPLLDAAEEWCKRRAVENALLKGFSIADGAYNETWSSLPEMVREAVVVSFAGESLGVRAADVPAEDIQPLWAPYLLKSKIHIFAALPGVGKGLVMMDLAARLTRGANWPLSEDHAPLGSVLWCDTEDGIADTLLPRAIGAGADRARLWFFGKPQEFAKLDLAAFIREQDIKLVVFNPGVSFLPGLKRPNDEMATREALDRLQQVVSGTECAAVLVMHPNKKGGRGGAERILGSRAWTGCARSVFGLREECQEENTKRLQHIKHNCSQRGDDLIVKVVPHPDMPQSQMLRIEWSAAESNEDVEDVFERKKHDLGGTLSAGDWLQLYLARGEVPYEQVIADGAALGYTAGALRKAHQRGPAVFGHRKDGFPAKSYWFLVEHQQNGSTAAPVDADGARLN